MPAGARGELRTRWYQSPGVNQRGHPNLVIWRVQPDGAFVFAYDDGTEFRIEANGRQIWCTWIEPATVADVAVYLRGPVLGFVLRLRGVVCLHASAIAAGESAIAMAGGGGAGKSTTAAGLVELGCRLLADDAATLRPAEGRFHVWPGHPRLNLWPDAAAALYGDARPLPRLIPENSVNSWWDKRYRDLDREREFHETPLPLGAVYLLGERSTEAAAPHIEALSPKDAFMALTEETYANYALDESMRAHEFKTLGQLVRTVPVRRVTAESDPSRLLALCTSILDDFEKLKLPANRS